MTFTSGALVDDTGGVTQHALKIHSPSPVHEACDETIRLLQGDLRSYQECVEGARKELGAFAEEGRSLADCLRDLKDDYEAEIKRLRKVVIENEIDRNDDWIRSELKGDQE